MGPARLDAAVAGGRVCLWAERDRERIPLMLPFGYTATVGPPLAIADETGAVVVRGSQVVWLGGGFVPATTLIRARLGPCLTDTDAFLVGQDAVFTEDPLDRD
jgi:hypothetical protein